MGAGQARRGGERKGGEGTERGNRRLRRRGGNQDTGPVPGYKCSTTQREAIKLTHPSHPP